MQIKDSTSKKQTAHSYVPPFFYIGLYITISDVNATCLPK